MNILFIGREAKSIEILLQKYKFTAIHDQKGKKIDLAIVSGNSLPLQDIKKIIRIITPLQKMIGKKGTVKENVLCEILKFAYIDEKSKLIPIPKIDTSSIVVRESRIHNNGVFAKHDIKKDARVIEYVGELISVEESERRADIQLEKHGKNPDEGSVYLFSISKKTDMDGNVPWNPAKFINHSCDPNCESLNEDGRIFLIAIKDIKKGEELSFDYGYDVDNYKDHPCRCGSKNCIGYIVAENQWPKLRKLLKH